MSFEIPDAKFRAYELGSWVQVLPDAPDVLLSDQALAASVGQALFFFYSTIPGVFRAPSPHPIRGLDSKRKVSTDSRYQHAQPILINSLDEEATATPLKRHALTSGTGDVSKSYPEAWLQRLIHRHPILLPVSEIEPGIGGLIPVGMELPTAGKSVDNLMVTPEGNLVLIECKLWRNAESRKKVVTQILDYAQILSEWSYTDLDSAVGRSRNLNGNPVSKPLTEIVRAALGEESELEDATFIDAVQRNLRMGRMLLLVVGDGIREDAASLGEFLRKNAGLHFTLSLVETAIYCLPTGGLLVQPRVLARTVNIERAIVRVIEGKPVVETPPEASSRPTTMSEEYFFERLGTASPETAAALRELLQHQQVRDLGVFIQPASKSASLRWEAPDGTTFSLGAVDLNGKLSTYSVCWAPSQTGQLDLAHEYLRELAKLADAKVRETKNDAQWYLASNSPSGGVTLPPALPILKRAVEWADLISTYQAKLSASSSRQ